MPRNEFRNGALVGALAVAALMAWKPELAGKLSDGAHSAHVWAAGQSRAWKARQDGASRPLPGPREIAQRARVVAAALKLKGIPYLYGGTAPATGFDCSGLTQYVFHNAGLTLPRSASDQRGACAPVPVDSLRPGDLCFFLIIGDNIVGQGLSHGLRWVGWPPDHVALYLGAGKMLHAPRTGKAVEVADFKDPFWQSRLLGVGDPFASSLRDTHSVSLAEGK